MDFIKQAIPYNKKIFIYVAGFLFAFLGGQFLGSIPLVLAMFMKSERGTLITDPFQLADSIGSNSFLALLLLPFVFSFLALIFWVKVVHKQPLQNLLTARHRFDWKRFWFAFLLWGAMLVLFTWLDFKFSPDDYVLNFELDKFLILCLIAVLLIPIQTTFEELMFRGYLLQGVAIVSKSRAVALVVTSLVFGLLHLANPEIGKLGYAAITLYIAMGFFLGIITLMDEGTELAVGFHAVNNLITALLVTADWTAFQTESILRDVSEPDLSFQFFGLIPLVVVLAIFAKKYGWSNWKNRLLGKIE